MVSFRSSAYPSRSYLAVALLMLGAAACQGGKLSGGKGNDCTACVNGAVAPGCCCGGEPQTDGYCCDNVPSEQPCGGDETCAAGPVTSACLCGSSTVTSGYCCDGNPSSVPCEGDNCGAGPVTTSCLCGSTTVTSGYCCGGVPQSTICVPLRLDGGLASGTSTYDGKIFYPLLPYLTQGQAADSVEGVTLEVPISNTELDGLYQNETWVGSTEATLEMPIANGSYSVHLHFVDWPPSATRDPGDRMFHIDLEGERRVTDLDIIATVGKNAALVKSFDVVVADGALTLTITKDVWFPEIAAVEILPLGEDHVPVVECGAADGQCPSICTHAQDSDCADSVSACAEGRVTTRCTCTATVVTTGYCCSGVAQENACGVVESADYYVSPYGDDASAGDSTHPFKSFEKAYSVAQAGQLIYFRGGVYHPKDPASHAVVLHGRNGTAGNAIRFWGYPGEKVVLDFSTMQDFSGTNSMVGIDFTGDYWHWKNIEFVGLPQYTGHYMSNTFVVRNCNHCIFEQMQFHGNWGNGFGITGTSTDNLVLNCDSYDNQDPIDNYENANGFMSVTDIGTTNTFRGCRAWHNADDGFDHFKGMGLVVHESCWAFWNGYIPNTFDKAGNGMGFKFGGSLSSQGLVVRTAKDCLAFGNREWGFDQNDLLDKIEMLNCTAYKNGQGINLNQNNQAHTIRNCISFGNSKPSGYYTDYAITAESTNDHNSWNSGVTATDADFLSVDSTGVDGPRGTDGSLPVLDYLKLAPTSDFIDKGVDVGLSYNGSAPDLGAYEH